MKSAFSTSWKRSKQPRKQRKYMYNAPIHIARKLISSILSKELRAKYNKRSIPLRKGDVVIIKSGKFKGKEGKIEEVLVKKQRVVVSGTEAIKSEGRKSRTSIHSSNLMIKELNLEDKKRKQILDRKKESTGSKKPVSVAGGSGKGEGK